MAPAPVHDPPHVQLGRLMVLARRRGVDFETFWRGAVREGKPFVMTNHPSPPPGCVRWPTDKTDRSAWASAIHASKEGWRRAFERAPAMPGDRALSLLGDSIGVLDRAAAIVAAEEMQGIEPQAAVLSAA